LFACRPGRRADGHDFAAQAVAAGSPALLCERELDEAVPQIVVASVAEALGPAASTVHGRPSRELTVIGVTGTSGKTTTAYLVEAALRGTGRRTGLIGTVATTVAGEPGHGCGARTTPEATDLQRLLRHMAATEVNGVAMEVSSHGLALGRVAGTEFAAAVFTNLSHDHLDFHSDLEDYFAAKARLFTSRFTSVAVVNVDDAWGCRLAGQVARADDVRVVRVSPSGAPADVRVVDVAMRPTGAELTVDCTGRGVRVRTRLLGRFNAANAACALAAAHAAGIDLEAAAQGMAALDGVPGRMQRVDAGQPYTVLVDFAHAPDSLRRVLALLRERVRGRIIAVFGCIGERDKDRRYRMGQIAAEGADYTIVTDDNPYSEDRDAIIAEIARGLREAGKREGHDFAVIPNRREAISQAIAMAVDGDAVLLAGKGHEREVHIADSTYPCYDPEV
ncbi:MAG: UDP-N-acetylmuramoyl-L-alanyl-D-glutamate--2,6-diaminopimelate ligase, partial [Gemmatimonadales bacterium]